jgi:hypothetical protein
LGNTTTTPFADGDFSPRRTPSAVAAKTTTPRKQIRRRLSRRRRRRREHYFRAVKVLAAEQQPHFSFSPFCDLSRVELRAGKGVEKTREKNTRTHASSQ